MAQQLLCVPVARREWPVNFETTVQPHAGAVPVRVRVLQCLHALIARILSSRSHGLLSAQLLLLQYVGRRSGNVYRVPLYYVSLGGHPYCISRHSGWAAAAAASPDVRVWLRGRLLRATATRLPPTSTEARVAFVNFLRANPGTARTLYRVTVDRQGAPRGADVDREIHRSILVRFTLNGQEA